MKRGISIFLLAVLLAALAACGTGQKVKHTGVYIYYVNTDGTALEQNNYQKKYEEPEKEIKRMLAELKKEPESIDYKSAIPDEVKVTGFEQMDTQLRVDFNKAYANMDAVQEVLCRSAVVQTLTQISGVEYVEFYADGAPLLDRDSVAVGLMQGSDFIRNTGSAINSYQVKKLDLYFADKAGDKLRKETVSVRYNSNISVEKLIVERLMKGPTAAGSAPTISPDANLLGVSVKDGICYVNFDEGFLNNNYDLVPEVPIYSIVNSIIDSGTATHVQISIAGETNITFKGTIKLDAPFEQNPELVEE